ncbi:acyl-CoA thioesterase [Streptomyces sp. NPDC056333]|uniref:acyl-CoA thioesterase n=1 Tax=Streptomyces sp. NPDC056333 TaxID=3345786 RepID=UPI0035D5E229
MRGSELDRQGHLNQAVHLQYAEHARWELLRAVGLPQEKLPAGGVGPVALEVTVEVPARTARRRAGAGTCRFAYGSGKTFEMVRKIMKGDGAVVAAVRGVAGMLDLAARRLIVDPAGRLASLAGNPDLIGG